MHQKPFALQFPGQGSQVVGMGAALYANSPAAAGVFDRADDVLGVPLSELCFAGPEDALNDTFNTQPALLTTSIAALRAFQEREGGDPAFVAGHSLGEFSALVAAGSLRFEDALYVVRERGRLMAEAGALSPGGMAAVIGLEADRVADACAQARAATGGTAGVANDNCPGQVVVSGDEETLQLAMAHLQDAGARRVIRLAVSIPAHSPLMADAADQFRRVLDAIPFSPPRVPVVTNATARPVDDPQALREVLGRQLISPVRWTESVAWMVAQGVERFVEVGPKDVLTGLLRRIDRSVEGQTVAQVLGVEV
ncbi:MAG: ACP S-malonyltransferase [Anaerolineae bacterium]|nr:ACP S-malonyltransferase [Anaerolineae bacterium]